eukprot:959326-Pyramimonas_sp.AAC.1
MGPMLSTPLAFFGLAVPAMACTCCGSIGERGSSFATVGRPKGAPGAGGVVHDRGWVAHRPLGLLALQARRLGVGDHAVQLA